MKTPLNNSINEYLVCTECQKEFESGMTDFGSMREYSRIDAGFTDLGFQVWCRRHDHNVCHINFEGNELSTDLRCIVASSSD